MTLQLLAPIVATDELLAATGDTAWLRALLDTEAALAKAQADVGIVPPGAAERIVSVCRSLSVDPADLGHAARLGGNPVIPLVTILRDALGPEVGHWVHWGSTSQDMMDSAQMLVAKRATDLIVDYVDGLCAACAAQAEAHRHTLMAGRTLMQQALPITFGLKAAGWLGGAVDAGRQLDFARQDLAVQLGGAAGTLASLGTDGPAVLNRFAAHLELAEPALPWHTARQRITALGGALCTLAGTAAKISNDVALLMQTEVAEVAEPSAPGRGGSSALPQKRNPVGAAAVSSAQRRATALVGVLYGALVAEHERAIGAWQAEWETLSELLALAGGAAARTAETVAGLEVDTERMRANLDVTNGLLMSERVSLALAGSLGSGAKQTVADAGLRATSSGSSLLAELSHQESVTESISPDDIEELFDPAGYLGSTNIWIDRALDMYRTDKQKTKDS